MPGTTDRVRVSAYGGGRFELTELTTTDIELLQGMANGQHWVTVQGGKLEVAPARGPLPAPTDNEMLLFWRTHEPKGAEIKQHSIPGESWTQWSHGSITIQHLCGYGYTPERYRNEAAKLERYGFECLRSRRGPSGQFWELWYLPGLWAAKGALETAVAGHLKAADGGLKKAIEFLCSNVSFGTLDASVQRAAMAIEGE